MDAPERLTTEVAGCARCGGHHLLECKAFRRPVADDDGTEWTHWATCPETGDSILCRRVEIP